jgi:hypothetical protein
MFHNCDVLRKTLYIIILYYNIIDKKRTVCSTYSNTFLFMKYHNQLAIFDPVPIASQLPQPQ